MYYPIFTGYIAALARRRHLDALRQVPTEKLIYCDTDSILTDGFSFETDGKIGGWKKECDFTHGKFYGEKSYVLTDKDGKVKKFALAGIPAENSDAQNLVDNGFLSYFLPDNFFAFQNVKKRLIYKEKFGQKNRESYNTPWNTQKIQILTRN